MSTSRQFELWVDENGFPVIFCPVCSKHAPVSRMLVCDKLRTAAKYSMAFTTVDLTSLPACGACLPCQKRANKGASDGVV